ncbi:hypothetical protein HYT01_03785 [Candidatus Giovannonibacteria bacterium]|nr:hypothetical protein [Candidatus Giovannonibacteria bacterium]
MTQKFTWIIFGFVMAIFAIILATTPFPPAGDIVEYYGITESLLNHGGFQLTQTDQENLEKILHPEYFHDPGYYIPGHDGQRYPVHFVFYSVLVLPARIFLQSFGFNPLNALPVTNLIIFAATLITVCRLFLKTAFRQVVFLVTATLSPLIFFLSWPGPDIYYVCLLLLAAFFFISDRYFAAAIAATLASWHSQPLLLLTAGIAGYYAYMHSSSIFAYKKVHFNTSVQTIIKTLFILSLAVIPYLFNQVIFGTLTPWTILQDGWTQMNGFGVQNMSLQKLYEQFFDLNMGLFWYAPVLVIAGIWTAIVIGRKDKRIFFLFLFLLITAFFYQTNPAWHYGTSGYGPSRHVLFILPFLIYIFVTSAKPTLKYIMLLAGFALVQIPILIFNGFLVPSFSNTHYHTPYAQYILNNFPQLYNPTPEIFVDRTNHSDLTYITSAFYKYNNVCKKAFVLLKDKELLRNECGFIPAGYEEKIDHPKDMLRGVYVTY